MAGPSYDTRFHGAATVRTTTIFSEKAAIEVPHAIRLARDPLRPFLFTFFPSEENIFLRNNTHQAYYRYTYSLPSTVPTFVYTGLALSCLPSLSLSLSVMLCKTVWLGRRRGNLSAVKTSFH